MWTERTELLLGTEGLEKLAASRVAVVGVGGVGAAAAEMLVRAGIGHIVIIDNDDVSESNINRQLLALHSTVGQPKVEVLRSRLLDINPELDLIVVQEYLTEDALRTEDSPDKLPLRSIPPTVCDVPSELASSGSLPLSCPRVDTASSGESSVRKALSGVDFVVDAIDTLSPKIALIQFCLSNGIPLVSSMGSGAKLDVTAVRIADISKTYECPLAHMLRKRLHKVGIRSGFKAVFSVEKPLEGATVLEESRNKKSQVGTISYLPTVFGCACAQVAIQTLTATSDLGASDA